MTFTEISKVKVLQVTVCTYSNVKVCKKLSNNTFFAEMSYFFSIMQSQSADLLRSCPLPNIISLCLRFLR